MTCPVVGISDMMIVVALTQWKRPETLNGRKIVTWHFIYSRNCSSRGFFIFYGYCTDRANRR